MPAELRILDIPPDGPCSVVRDADQAAPPPPGVVRWIDIQAQEESTLKLLADRFGFHPLTIEDCLHVDQRPKLEEYGDYLFVVIHGFSCPTGKAHDVVPHELHAFLGTNYLVTVHEDAIEPLDRIWKRAAGEPALAAARRLTSSSTWSPTRSSTPTSRSSTSSRTTLEEIENAVLERAAAVGPGPDLLAQAHPGGDAQGSLPRARRLLAARQARRSAHLREDRLYFTRRLRSPGAHRRVDGGRRATCWATRSTRTCR